MAEADPYERIETALDRIEAVLKRPDPELTHLRLRHARLRARVEDAVAALDALAAPLPIPDQAGDGIEDSFGDVADAG